MEKTGCKIICGAPTTLAVKGLMMMVSLRQILFCLAIAEAILMGTFADQVPFSHSVAPRYWKLVISSNFWPFIVISALALLVLLVMILLFSVLASIPYADTLFMNLLVRSLSSPMLPPIRSMSSENHRLQI